ncbi:MAG: ABC transporter ATP-binding protein [Prochlorotrichaceae cyanobacterium]|jgi:ATP-binding cassette subfamily B protein
MISENTSAQRFQKLLNYQRPYWQWSVGGIVSLLLVNLLGVYIPLLIRNGVDELQTDFALDRVIHYALIVVLLASVMWVMRMTSRMLIFGIGRKVEGQLKQRIFNHLLTLDAGYFARNTIGDIINRATSDVDNIRRLVGFAVLSLVNTIFAYALTLPVMLYINVRLTLLAILVYPLMLGIVQLFSTKLRVQQQDVQEQLSKLSELIQEDISGISLIKIYAQEVNERQAFGQLNDRLLNYNLVLAGTRNFLFPLLEGLASISLLVLLGFGSGAIAQGTITIGDFIALLLYVERLVFPTALLGFTITAYQRGEVSIDRIEAILMAEPKIKDNPQTLELPTPIKGWIKADHLTFTYPDAVKPSLNDLCFTIYPGETLAIVGPIGSGKSTLANALLRLIEIEPNQLFLDHLDVTQLPLHTLRKAIGYVPQDSFLFSTAIRNNIRYGVPDSPQSSVEKVAKEAQIHPEILNFPQQYETIVGERGITLSGGQRQRTALARALLLDAPILVLDDSLSSVDNQTATAILQNLSGTTQKKTVVFISHQLSAAALADRIMVMDQGRIVQIGTHEELITQSGLYQQLWNRQKLAAILQ